MGKFQLLLSLSLSLSLLLAVARAMEFDESDLESDERLWDLYKRWRSYHTISRDLTRKQKRFNVFIDNVKFIHEFNKEELPYKLRLNRFGDMTNQEFRRSYGSSRVEHFRALRGPRRRDQPFIYEKAVDLPHSIDWRKKGAVSYVKDQGQCGSCWAFSTVVAVEGINAIKTGKLVALSEQELVDCDKGENDGCNGGLMEDAFEYIKKTNGITTEDAYPYRAGEGPCIIKKNAPVVVIDGYQSVPVNDEKSLKKAVAHQPVSVAMDASGRHFQFYSEGVFNGKCGSELDHGVAIVGYGTTLDGTKYWIVKNSWGPEWGEKGYLRMKREVPQKEGLCGIAREASYPIKTSPNPNVTKVSPSKEEL